MSNDQEPKIEIGKIVTVRYTNYRGETAIRRIEPIRTWFGATDYHPEEQWLIDALDVDKGVERTFAWRDMQILADEEVR